MRIAIALKSLLTSQSLRLAGVPLFVQNLENFAVGLHISVFCPGCQMSQKRERPLHLFIGANIL